jgi:hypothetical protein
MPGLNEDELQRLVSLEQGGELSDYDRGSLYALKRGANEQQQARVTRLLERASPVKKKAKPKEPAGYVSLLGDDGGRRRCPTCGRS